ncbi:phage terminase small subunit [Qipengyuania citrea]|uniref:phage terminase small subunit n=1 Tax=Qipengyuania citrea TaxID=225971 RepID=UPI0020A203FE|nr:phage terminase small subunit [Qipengyuania citrea]MCP2016831.1 hypothetical protein [Qipengyuania citrea]
MSTSPFLRNRHRRLAAAAGKAATAGIPQAPDEASEAGQEYAVLKVRLDDNLRKLADVASHEARLPLKAEFLATFRPWVEGVVEADAPVQDEILLTSMVWAIDVGDFERAVDLGAFALKHGLAMPERYNRSVACFLREDIAEAALADADVVSLETLVRVDHLTADADMPDAAKAKLDKALGRAWAAKADSFDAADDNAPAGGAAAFVDQALGKLRRALGLDKKVGVKKDIEKLERRLRDLRTEAAANGAAQEQQAGDAGG